MCRSWSRARALLTIASLSCACSFSSTGAESAGSTSASEGEPGESEAAGTSAATASSSTAGVGSTSAGTTGVALDPWRRKIGLRNADGLAPLLDFPVPVALTPAEIDALGDVGGADLRFLDSDGVSVLAHEIERWDPERGALIWVLVPEVALSDDDFFWMHGGELALAPGEAPQQVWADGYALVLHMSDDPGDGSPGAHNTAGSHDAAYQGGMDSTNRTNGEVGGAFVLDGEADFLSVPAALSTDAWTGLTVSAWVRHDVDDDDRIVCKSPTTTAAEHVLSIGLVLNEALRVRLATDGEGGEYAEHDVFAGVVPVGEWAHVAFTWDGARDRLVISVNGTVVREAVHGGETLLDSPELITIGNVNGYDLEVNNRLFAGAIDELRVSSVARSEHWLAAQARAMDGSMLDYGAIELL